MKRLLGYCQPIFDNYLKVGKGLSTHSNTLNIFLRLPRFCDFIVKYIISLISGALLKEEPCCKFMLKHNITNYFRQFT